MSRGEGEDAGECIDVVLDEASDRFGDQAKSGVGVEKRDLVVECRLEYVRELAPHRLQLDAGDKQKVQKGIAHQAGQKGEYVRLKPFLVDVFLQEVRLVKHEQDLSTVEVLLDLCKKHLLELGARVGCKRLAALAWQLDPVIAAESALHGVGQLPHQAVESVHREPLQVDEHRQVGGRQVPGHLIEDRRLACAPLAVEDEDMVLMPADQIVYNPGKDILPAKEHALSGHRVASNVGIGQWLRTHTRTPCKALQS